MQNTDIVNDSHPKLTLNLIAIDEVVELTKFKTLGGVTIFWSVCRSNREDIIRIQKYHIKNATF